MLALIGDSEKALAAKSNIKLQGAMRKIEARCHIIGSQRLAERIRHCADSDDGWVSAMYFNATLW